MKSWSNTTCPDSGSSGARWPKPALPEEPESDEEDACLDPPSLDIDEARSDNASFRLLNIDRARVDIAAAAVVLWPLTWGPGVELEDTVNVAGVPAESLEDAMTSARGIIGAALYG